MQTCFHDTQVQLEALSTGPQTQTDVGLMGWLNFFQSFNKGLRPTTENDNPAIHQFALFCENIEVITTASGSRAAILYTSYKYFTAIIRARGNKKHAKNNFCESVPGYMQGQQPVVSKIVGSASGHLGSRNNKLANFNLILSAFSESSYPFCNIKLLSPLFFTIARTFMRLHVHMMACSADAWSQGIASLQRWRLKYQGTGYISHTGYFPFCSLKPCLSFLYCCIQPT